MNDQKKALAGIAPQAKRLEVARQIYHPRAIELSRIHVVEGLNARGYATGESAFEGPDFQKLVDSIRLHEVIQPILLRPHPSRPGEYQLVAGERRYRASLRLGLNDIPAEVRDLDDEEMLLVSRAENDARAGVREVDYKIKMLDALARYAGILVGDLRRVLLRLRKNPQQAWEEESVERRVQDAMRELIPDASVSTLVRSWTRYLDFTEDERLALRDGVGESVLLPLLKLPEGEERQELLNQAIREGWTAQDMVKATAPLLGTPLSCETLRRTSRTFKGLLSDRKLAALDHEAQRQFEAELVALQQKYFG